MGRPPIRKPPRSLLTIHRTRQGLTLLALSDRTKPRVSVPFLGALEIGTRNASPAVWVVIARALGVTVAEIRPVTEEDAKQPMLFDPDLYLEIAGDPHEP
jgi:hypothetical protein